MRPTLLALVLVLAACGRSDNHPPESTRLPRSTAATAPRGPDNLVLRLPRAGGTARVYAYPRLDTVVWSTKGAPAPARVLAFDDEAGRLAYVDAKGLPARLDFRQGAAYNASKNKVTGLASADGTDIFGIAADGSVERYTPTGNWKWKPPVAARAVFPQPDGTLLAMGERAGSSVVWRIHPPALAPNDSVVLTRVDRTLRTQVGDRLYLASGDKLTGLLTRSMQRSPDVTFDAPVELLMATPSGDRVFAVTKTGTAIDVVDRSREQLTDPIQIGRNVSEMRMDPLGRYLLVRADQDDSAIVVDLGANRVAGTVATDWRADLPFVAPDGAIATALGEDVIFVAGETLKPTARVRQGAADFWYAFRWNGFRPRDAKLDQPVEFAVPPSDSARMADSLRAAAGDSGAPHPTLTPSPSPSPAPAPRSATPAPARDTAPRRAAGYIVSFAAFPVAEPARALAAKIRVGNESARVTTAMNGSTTIYRVVLGPYPTRDEADRVGRDSHQSYWVYEGGP